jgi:putative transposase
MTNIRRYDSTHRPVFMTSVCFKRNSYLRTDRDKELLLSVMREVKSEKPYTMLGYVVLDDHFHWMIRLDKPTSGLSESVSNLSGSASRTLTYDPINKNDLGRSGCDRGELPDNQMIQSKHAISAIMQSVKLRFTHRYKKTLGINNGNPVWQRRFWDHIARDQNDINRHLDYIHYNPVKHGYAPGPLDYSFSSFPTYVERGVYRLDWGRTGEPEHLAGEEWE